MIMKKSLLILAIILCANIIYAQTEKGTLYISGSTMLDLSFDSQTFENGEKIENDITNISFIPSIGIFIIDNMVVGLDLLYTHAKEDPKDGVEMKETSFAIMPMVRYYIPMENDFRPFIHAGIGWIKWKADVDEGVEVDADGMVFGGGAGISYFVKDNISLDLGVNYIYSKKSGDFMGEDWDLKDSIMSITFGMSIFFN